LAAAPAMGKLARIVDGIKTRLNKKKGEREEEASAACYGKVDKTESMRVEIRSRRAQQLIAKNLSAADNLGAKKIKKRFFDF
jgi:two-component SAPR family response regulator